LNNILSASLNVYDVPACPLDNSTKFPAAPPYTLYVSPSPDHDNVGVSKLIPGPDASVGEGVEAFEGKLELLVPVISKQVSYDAEGPVQLLPLGKDPMSVYKLPPVYSLVAQPPTSIKGAKSPPSEADTA
jgi:hypothetical protein